MNLNHDIEVRASVKLAGLTDSLRSAFNSISGNYGTLPSPLMAAGGALLGGMAGKGLGIGSLGAGMGAMLGGGMGYAGSNAINQQSLEQEGMDSALMGGVAGGFGANDQTDAAQNQAIIQNSVDLDGIKQMLGLGGMGGQPDMGMGGMDQGMQGMDPSMMGGMQPQDMSGMMSNPNLGGLSQGGAPDQNGIGPQEQEDEEAYKQGSSKFANAVTVAVNKKLAELKK